MARVRSSERMVFGIFVALIGAVAALIWSVVKPTSKNSKRVPLEELTFLPQQFVIYDLETTGLDPTRHEIIEIGAIRVNRDSDTHHTFKTLVIPSGRVSSRITQLTGITSEMIKNEGRPLKEALKGFLEFVGDLPLIAYNSDFDRSFLRASCRRADSGPITNTHWCALAMTRQAWPGRSSYRLSDLARDGGLAAQSHRALDDCHITLQVYISAALTIGAAKPGRIKSPPSTAPRAARATSGGGASGARPPGFA